MNQIQKEQQDFYRIYKIVHYLEMVNMEIESTNRNNIDIIVYNALESVYKRNKRFIKELKQRIPDFNEIFEDITNEKIFAMMTIIQKMTLLTEEQALEFEKSLEIEEK